MQESLQSIVDIAGCYRQGELGFQFDTNHVQRWVNQFDQNIQKILLDELAYVLNQTYISRKKMKAFLLSFFNALQTDDSKCEAWKNIHLLNIQGRGNSQQEMLELFNEVLYEECNGEVSVQDCKSLDAKAYVYLDDFIFTGLRLRTDLENWVVNQAPNDISLYVFTYGTYAGSWSNKNSLEQTIEQTGKNINLQFINKVNFENRRTYSSTSDVLWPSRTPNDNQVQCFENQLTRAPHKRQPIPLTNSIFSSGAGRELLEQQFLIKGVDIINRSRNFGAAHKPLGFLGFDSFGFGAMHLTYRNCPNNTPLALWASEPWYPLFPRKTN